MSAELNEMSQILMLGPDDIIIYLHYQGAEPNRRHVRTQNLWIMHQKLSMLSKVWPIS